MVQELNNFITMKKERSSAVDAKKELLAESSSGGQQKTVSGEWQAILKACVQTVSLHWNDQPYKCGKMLTALGLTNTDLQPARTHVLLI